MEADTLTACPARRPLGGTAHAPGDKSLSHRALIFAALARGESRISGLLESEDTAASIRILRALGADISKKGKVFRVGGGVLRPPAAALDCGNSGTSARLIAGVLAAQDFAANLTGDESLAQRPMARVFAPLQTMGAQIAAQNGHLPARISGNPRLKPIRYRLPVASAQVKSALLLAALFAQGESEITDPFATRNHSELMLPLFGAALRVRQENGADVITLAGPAALQAAVLAIPADPSAAALLAAAVLPGGGKLVLPSLCLNPRRFGFYRQLERMGARLTISNRRLLGGEESGDVHIAPPPKGESWRAIEVAARDAPAMIDEYPALAVLAAHAQGVSVFRGLEELRVKESDRLSALRGGLEANGVAARLDGKADLVISGGGLRGGGVIAAKGDHRIAMAFLALGLAAANKVRVTGCQTIASSFPSFRQTLAALGGRLEG